MQSPSDIESKWESLEQSFVAKAKTWPLWLPPVFLVIHGLIYWQVIWPLHSVGNMGILRSELFDQRNSLFAIFIISGFLSFYLKSRWVPIYSFLVAGGGWIYICLEDYGGGWASLAFPLLLLLAYLYLKFAVRNRKMAWLGGSVFTLAYFGVGYLLALEANSTGNTKSLAAFWALHPQFFLLFVVAAGLFITNKSMASLALNPVNIGWSFLWPEESSVESENKTKQREIWWQGLWNLFVGSLCILLAFLAKYFLIRYQMGLAPRLFFIYAYYIFFVVGSFNQCIAIARFFGVNAPDPTHFLIFAKTPLETWQRGSTYLYRFFLRYIYLPSFRWTGRYSLTLIICFIAIILHMFLFHELIVRSLYNFLVPGLNAPAVRWFEQLTFSFTWASLWYFWILIGASLWSPFVKKASPLNQWISVALNHLVAASIYPVTVHIVVPLVTS